MPQRGGLKCPAGYDIIPRMSEEQLLTMVKDLQAKIAEVEFKCRVLMNRYGITKGQLETYRELDERGELG